MRSDRNKWSYQAAVRDFDRARKQAAIRQLMSRLTGKSSELLSYNEIQSQLKVVGEVQVGIREIPLDAIVGSVGRYQDFTRDFLPKHDSNEERWASVRTAVIDMKGMKPIDVYQIGEVYFVKDGNHRVSVARQLGAKTITAYVTEVKTRVPLTRDDDPSEVICKARYVQFLEHTNLDKLRPDANLSMVFCGQFQLLLDQIENQRHLLSDEEKDEVPYENLVTFWYDEVYLPVIKLIREQGMLRNFPGMTETDIYVLFSERRAELEEALGWKIGPETAVTELAEEGSRRSRPVIARVGERLRHAIVPDELEEGPEPGKWRLERVAFGRKDRLFADYLVAISGSESDWKMLDEIVRMAQFENDHLLGLHVVSEKSRLKSPQVQAIRERFEKRCRRGGIQAEFAVEVGKVADVVIKRAALADLVVTSLVHPPGRQPLARLGHGFNRLVQRCPRPILAVPSGAKCRIDRILLAYDGSPKSDEALYVTAYLASRWPISVTVVTVETEYTTVKSLRHARRYLQQYGVQRTEYVLRPKPIAEAIMNVAALHDSTMLIMGGFGHRPVLHLVVGSSVDQILREFRRPILICR